MQYSIVFHLMTAKGEIILCMERIWKLLFFLIANQRGLGTLSCTNIYIRTPKLKYPYDKATLVISNYLKGVFSLKIHKYPLCRKHFHCISLRDLFTQKVFHLQKVSDLSIQTFSSNQRIIVVNLNRLINVVFEKL